MIKVFEIIEIRIEEGLDIGFKIKDSLFLQYGVMGGGGDSLIVQCCKWTTSLAKSTWVICQ